MPARALEFYAGIGGLHLALQRSSVDGTVVQAFDWDQTACQAYRINHPPKLIEKVDISELSAAQLAAYNADLWLLSPSCQPYTVLNPNAKGGADPRAKSFLHLVQEVLPKLAEMNALPSRLLVENVAGFETSITRRTLVSTMRSLGYNTLELLLTPLQFGIPNSRLRYYFLAKKDSLQFSHVAGEGIDRIWRHIPGQGRDWVDDRFDSTEPSIHVASLSSYLDSSDETSDYSIPDKILFKWGRLFDVMFPSSRRSCCFTRGYTQLVQGAGSILQMNEELDTTSVFNEFAAARPDGPDAVRILDPLQLRYFSPGELLRIFGFNPPVNSAEVPRFRWPDTKAVTVRSQYKLIGNSVNVTVLQVLIEYLFSE
ncbi:S-adenosyl-L-methionine-dependent methyltransferase [Macrolepiota fuliginosa MF-IS2]|uniref:tRNA (cytosine(38)-C(5))-methyltransferase n=1 Tax=Macrolepiota fuliginosa MF-IS2 TaxID=1400762 RepID=A0A9P5XD72_9AGAR|nr:S-adenosyl-L-methionine-dependent methyltransferase [Macrolepiota fuliginosa MF-IS2]